MTKVIAAASCLDEGLRVHIISFSEHCTLIFLLPPRLPTFLLMLALPSIGDKRILGSHLLLGIKLYLPQLPKLGTINDGRIHVVIGQIAGLLRVSIPILVRGC